jgi:ankyrin repeat protein
LCSSGARQALYRALNSGVGDRKRTQLSPEHQPRLMYTMMARAAEPMPEQDRKAARGAKKSRSVANVSKREFTREGPLCKAIKAQNWALAETLVSKETVLEKDHEERLPLHLACEFGASPELVLQLLENNEAAREEVESGVWDSAERGEKAKVGALVQPPFKRDSMSRMPLHYAAAAGASEDVLTLLLDFEYPDGQYPTSVRESFYGMTPAELAVKKGHPETAKFIEANKQKDR